MGRTKRGADKYLTSEDPEDEVESDEEPSTGPMARADDKTLATRKIAKGKRKASDKQGSTFSGFSFNAASANSTTSAPSFGSSMLAPSSFGSSTVGSKISFGAPAASTSSSSTSAFPATTMVPTFGSGLTSTGSAIGSSSISFGNASGTTSSAASLLSSSDSKTTQASSGSGWKKLNQDFLAWVKTQLARPETVDLSPGLQSYLSYASKLRASPAADSDSAEETKTSFPVFGNASTSISSTGSGSLKFGGFGGSAMSSLSSTASSQPKAGASLSFSFGASSTGSKAEASQSTGAEDDTAEDSTEKGNGTPSNKSNEQQEADTDSVYRIQKTKLYYQADKDGTKEWTDRGICELDIKEEDGAYNLLLRDTSTSRRTMLVFKIIPGMTFSRQKNTVMFSVIPFPPLPKDKKQKEQEEAAASKAIPHLIKVKTQDMASELVDKLNEYQQKEKSP